MPIHDWSRVEPGTFHAFHHSWIEEIQRTLNTRVLGSPYYAVPEQLVEGFGPDVLTLHGTSGKQTTAKSNGLMLKTRPKMKPIAEKERDFYLRKQNRVTVRRTDGAEVVAIIEIVSHGNKSSQSALDAFVKKAVHFLENRVHLMFVDVHPPTRICPQGIHAAIWERWAGDEYNLPRKRHLVQASYECDLLTRAFVVNAAIGDRLTDMPLFLDLDVHVNVPLEATYMSAFAALAKPLQEAVTAPPT